MRIWEEYALKWLYLNDYRYMRQPDLNSHQSMSLSSSIFLIFCFLHFGLQSTRFGRRPIGNRVVRSNARPGAYSVQPIPLNHHASTRFTGTRHVHQQSRNVASDPPVMQAHIQNLEEATASQVPNRYKLKLSLEKLNFATGSSGLAGDDHLTLEADVDRIEDAEHDGNVVLIGNATISGSSGTGLAEYSVIGEAVPLEDYANAQVSDNQFQSGLLRSIFNILRPRNRRIM